MAAADDRLARALAVERASADRAAGDVRPLPPLGHVLVTPDLPAVRAVNCLRLEGGHPGITVADLVALLDAHLPDAAAPQVDVEDGATGRRLEPSLLAEGFTVDREVVMALTDEPDRAPGAAAVRPGGEEDVVDLYARWFGEDETTAGASDQWQEWGRRERAGDAPRQYVVDGQDGRPAAMAQLRADEHGGVAQIEDVFTRADERGRGHARALVGHLAQVARDEGYALVVIVADETGTARGLYAKLGFAPLGVIYSAYRRRPPA